MKKLLFLAVLFWAVLSAISCSDGINMDGTSTVSRDYQTDSRILAKLVDVNKTIGEYYINENKKSSALSYITDKDRQELQLVNPVNYQRFESELKNLNASIAAVAARPNVSHIVFTTIGETYVKEIDRNSSFSIEKTINAETRVTRSTYGSLPVFPDSKYPFNFTAGPTITSRIQLNVFDGSYFFFEILCKSDASKYPDPNYNPKLVVLSGYSMLPYDYFTWTANNPSGTQLSWEFESYGHEPRNVTTIANVIFED